MVFYATFVGLIIALLLRDYTNWSWLFIILGFVVDVFLLGWAWAVYDVKHGNVELD